MAWFGLDGTPITADDAAQLIADRDARTIATDRIDVRPGLLVEVRTVFTVHAETGEDDAPVTPMWETESVVWERTVEGHMTHADGKRGHAETVQRFRAAAARTGAHATRDSNEARSC